MIMQFAKKIPIVYSYRMRLVCWFFCGRFSILSAEMSTFNWTHQWLIHFRAHRSVNITKSSLFIIATSISVMVINWDDCIRYGRRIGTYGSWNPKRREFKRRKLKRRKSQHRKSERQKSGHRKSQRRKSKRREFEHRKSHFSTKNIVYWHRNSSQSKCMGITPIYYRFIIDHRIISNQSPKIPILSLINSTALYASQSFFGGSNVKKCVFCVINAFRRIDASFRPVQCYRAIQFSTATKNSA